MTLPAFATELIANLMPHTATIAGLETIDQKLTYDGGTAAWTVGEVVSGGTSHATGTVKSKSGTTASGYLVLSGVTGTFLNDEVLTGSMGGAAVANGANANYSDDSGGSSTTRTSTSVSCQFRQARSAVMVLGSGPHIVTSLEVLVPAGTAVHNGYTVTTTADGYTGTYLIQGEPVPEWLRQAGVGFLRCALEVVQ